MVLCGSRIIDYSETEISNMQRIKDIVYKQILGAPIYTPECTLRGEVGSLMMQSRIMENQLKYIQNEMHPLMEGIGQELRIIKKARWKKNIREYLKLINITSEKLAKITKRCRRAVLLHIEIGRRILEEGIKYITEQLL